MYPIRAIVLLTLLSLSAYAVDSPSRQYFVTSDNIKIRYIDQGQGSPVVLIHGYNLPAEDNWVSNGIVAALAKNHRVVALDLRGHGLSEKPHDAAHYGDRIWMDVIELMDRLSIEKAHFHGYSMGGSVMTELLVRHPERFITAIYGGCGVPEIDPVWIRKVPPNTDATDPQDAEALAKFRAPSPVRDEEALTALRAALPGKADKTIDLTALAIPVLLINGEFDKLNSNSHRLQREVKDFQCVVLPGKSHLTAIMKDYIPALYAESLLKFIDANDE